MCKTSSPAKKCGFPVSKCYQILATEIPVPIIYQIYQVKIQLLNIKVTGHVRSRFSENCHCTLDICLIFIKFSPKVR